MSFCPVCRHRKDPGRSTCGRPKCFEIVTWGATAAQQAQQAKPASACELATSELLAPAPACACYYTIGDNDDCPAHKDAFFGPRV